MTRTRILILALFLFCGSFISLSQNTLKLTNKNNGKEILIKEGTRVGYFINGKSAIRTGDLNTISDSTLKINNDMIPIHNIKAIGLRKKGTAIYSIGLAAVSGCILGYSLGSTELSSGLKAVGLISSASLFTYSIHFGQKNTPKKLKKKWILTIVD
ncbi:MAG: hypothetical protein R3342_13375 [Lutibacter sp.]|uniref:hypothetical protein n=1 Tax=Lutibacter sp. TaxID=1925666 RepID=UPI00299DD3B4|nr:hypothetical protein [Lutibacter sp.]MDX1830525.1 hypothetical protein [Lutibacter sp.]